MALKLNSVIFLFYVHIFAFSSVFGTLWHEENQDSILKILRNRENEHLDNFQEFTRKYNKKYDTQEEWTYRFSVFSENMDKLEKMMQENEKGTAVFGATKFADLTIDEVRATFGGLKRSSGPYVDQLEHAAIPDIKLPTDFDWRHHNAVTHVKNQGTCASCYAFSVAGNIEGLYAIKNKQLVPFSEQEILDCDDLDFGCQGGEMVYTYEAIKKIGGLESEEDYPYRGEIEDKCGLQKEKIKVTVAKGLNISDDENDMAKWLVEHGPISVGINMEWLPYYMGGIDKMEKNLCDQDYSKIDHALVLVGFGVEKIGTHSKEPYWILKNSWGPDWGEDGYYRMARGIGMCGVNKYVTTAVLAD